MIKKWGLPLAGALVAATVLVAAAGAIVQPPGLHAADLSSRAGVTKYLESIGIDAQGIVIQRGQHNYAGPNCPGVRWTCTTAKRVLQIASGNRSDNNFECTASPSPGFSNPPNTCKIVQVSAGPTNNARCVEKSTDAAASQSCLIYQTNTTGENNAEIYQFVDANDGASQNATQYAGVTQTTGSGTNGAQVGQYINQSSKTTDAAGAQTQDGHQTVSISQTTTIGDNYADGDQSLSQKAEASGGASITQKQNTDGSLNSAASIRQESDSGFNSARLKQTNDLDAHAKKTPTAFQTQGSSGSGMLGHFEQDSTGLSKVKGSQKEHQDFHLTKVGTSTQVQYGPMWFGSDQGSNPNDRYDIDQQSTQHAPNPTFESDVEYENCDTTGICTATQRVNQNGGNQQNSCSQPSCHIGQTSVTTEGETSTSTCTGLGGGDFVGSAAEVSSCPRPPTGPPPPPPPSPPIDITHGD